MSACKASCGLPPKLFDIYHRLLHMNPITLPNIFPKQGDISIELMDEVYIQEIAVFLPYRYRLGSNHR